MPDVWTSSPQKLKNMLSHGGFKCGLEPKVVKDRNPNWTCGIDTQVWYGEIYIHPLQTSWTSGPTTVFMAIALILGIAAGYIVGQKSEKPRNPLKLKG
jgi:hypothetical protein